MAVSERLFKRSHVLRAVSPRVHAAFWLVPSERCGGGPVRCLVQKRGTLTLVRPA